MATDYLAIKRDHHHSSFAQSLSSARSTGDYCDVTLVCDNNFYHVHKLVLASCSEYFTLMLQNTVDKHPLIVLADVNPKVLVSLLDYMYDGNVTILHSELPALLKAAGSYKIKGLVEIRLEDFSPVDVRPLQNDRNTSDSNIYVKKNISNSKRTLEYDNDVAAHKRLKADNNVVHSIDAHIKQEPLELSSISSQDESQNHMLSKNNTEISILQDSKPQQFLNRWLRIIKGKSRVDEHKIMSIDQYNTKIQNVKVWTARMEEAKGTIYEEKIKGSSSILKKIEVVNIEGVEKLIKKRETKDDPILYIVPNEELYDTIEEVHYSNGHVGITKLMVLLKKKYANITNECAREYLSYCDGCATRG